MTDFSPRDGCLVSAALCNLLSFFVAHFCNFLKIVYQVYVNNSGSKWNKLTLKYIIRLFYCQNYEKRLMKVGPTINFS